LLADLHPEAAAVFAAQLLLDEPDLEDAHADAAHQRLLQNQPPDADPVVLAALRIAAGPRGRDLDADIALLNRLHTLSSDDPARVTGVLPVLANAITATYDDQPLLYASGDESGPDPSAALGDAAIRLGGDGVPCYQVTPRYHDASRQALSSRRNNHTGPPPGEQRPELQPGIAGVISAVRTYANSRYGTDDNTPSWDTDAITNIVGWQLLATADHDGSDAAIRLLHRVTEEFSGLADSTVLAHIATGLDQRRAANHEQLDHLTSTAYALAFTKIRGGGGWKNFAGRDRLDLWERAAAIDADTAATVLANQVVARLEGQGYETSGIPEALIAAFATRSPDPELPQPHTALACWDAAMDVIAYRIPGTIHSRSTAYAPDTPLVAQIDVNVAMSRLALATIALPTRADRRRALVAATVLLAARPAIAQTAMAHVLTANLGAGPLTWLLHVLRDHLDVRNLSDALKNQLVVLARCDLLSVRVMAAEILEAAGQEVPAPPATAAHPALSSAVAHALHEEP
jgi:hypothetical protein